MENLFDDTVSTADLQKFEQIYNAQLKLGTVTPNSQFEYACCLVRSKFPADIKKGILLLKDLGNSNPDSKRDYIYFIAIGYARLKEYTEALEFCRKFLQIEPNNPQVLALERQIQEKLTRAGRDGMLAVGGGLMAVGAAIVAGALVLSRLK